ncbi:MAG: AAA-like domain-containing protein [Chloroflexota bacterium]
MTDYLLASLNAGQWDDLIHDAIKRWHRPTHLADSPLLALQIVAARVEKEKTTPTTALKAVIDEAILNLAPNEETPPSLDNPSDQRWFEPNWRSFCILRGLTIRNQRFGADKMQLLVGVSESHYFREYGKARMMLAEELRRMEGIPTGSDETGRDRAPWRLEFPSGGMRVDDAFYIERAADQELTQALRYEGQTITIRGSRQVGKTSLLARGIQAAQERLGAQLVYLDFQGLGDVARESLREMLRALSFRIFRTLELDLAIWEQGWAYDFLPQENMQELMEHVLRHTRQPILLAMDEVDVLQLTSFSKDFFSLLRSWHNLRAGIPLWRKLTLMMAISTEPYLLIDRVGESPFNTGHVLYLNDFTQHQVADLNRRYGTPLAGTELDALYRLLGGHPYLTRVALYTLVAGKVSWPILEAQAASDDGPFHQHLRWQLQRIEDDQRLLAAVVAVLGNQSLTDRQVGYHLLKAGLVTKAGDNYVCRCELYRRYFADRLNVRAI